MKRKVLSLLLATSMVASLAACGGSEKPKDSKESTPAKTNEATGAGTEAGTSEEEYKLDKLTMVVNGTLTTNLENGQADFEKQWEDAVGIDLVIKQLDHSGYVDAVGRTFASGEYPDVIIMSADMYAQYASVTVNDAGDTLLWDMTSAYENSDFFSRVTLPEINENIKVNGKLLGFAPAYGNGCVTYVKQAWLDAVGLKAEDITDYESYYNMLEKFVNEDPDGNGVKDTYGVAAAKFLGEEAPWTNYLPEFWQDAYPAFVQDANGVWYDGFNTQATKDALVRLQTAYADGVIDPETLTMGTKDAREKFYSADQAGSFGAFTYWAGTWYQNMTDSLDKNGVETELVMLPPIAEVGAYINREAPVWCIINDGDGNDAREQAIFDAFIETMMDGDTVQMLWTYGAEDVHWSTKAESFTVGEGDKAKPYDYAEGEFHLRPTPNDPNTLWKKNHLEAQFVVAPLTNGLSSVSDKISEGNAFFTANSVNAPQSASSQVYTENAGTLNDLKLDAVTTVITAGGDVDEAMAAYEAAAAQIVDAVLADLNKAE